MMFRNGIENIKEQYTKLTTCCFSGYRRNGDYSIKDWKRWQIRSFMYAKIIQRIAFLYATVLWQTMREG